MIIFKKAKLSWLNWSVALVIFGSINTGHYLRNYEMTGNVFATNETIYNHYVNEKHSLKMMVSNVTRNLSLQFGLPKIAPIAFNITKSIHEIIGLDLNDPEITSYKYEVDPLSTHENNGANTYHVILILFCFLWLLIFFKNQKFVFRLFWLAIILSFLIF